MYNSEMLLPNSRWKPSQLHHPARKTTKLVSTNYIPALLQPMLKIPDSDKILAEQPITTSE